MWPLHQQLVLLWLGAHFRQPRFTGCTSPAPEPARSFPAFPAVGAAAAPATMMGRHVFDSFLCLSGACLGKTSRFHHESEEEEIEQKNREHLSHLHLNLAG
jgi:hypothetical protein